MSVNMPAYRQRTQPPVFAAPSRCRDDPWVRHFIHEALVEIIRYIEYALASLYGDPAEQLLDTTGFISKRRKM